MKSTSKMMVIAAVLLVVAALLVMPASALRVDATDDIKSGDTIFVYEEDLTFSDADFPGIEKLAYYSSDIGEEFTPDNTIDVPNGKLGELFKSEVGSDTGLYFAQYANGSLLKGRPSVNIKMPDVSIDAKLVEADGTVVRDSLNDKTVTQNANIVFEITSNIGTAFAGSDGTPYGADLKILTPGGGERYSLGNSTTLKNIPLNSTKVVTQVISLENADDGVHTVNVEFSGVSSVFDNEVKATPVKFTVSTKDITIESNKESVVRNNPFAVTITGDSKTQYYVYIKRTGSLNPDQYPWIDGVQASVDSTEDAYNTMKADTNIANELVEFDEDYPTAAIISTGVGGTRTVEFSTDSSTDDTSYTVKVYDPENDKEDDVKVKVEEGEITITAEGAGKYFLGEEIKLSGTNTDSDKVYLFMTGPNLGRDGNGVPLDNINQDVTDTKVDVDKRYVSVNVEGDDTWEYRWNTAATDMGGVLDSGSYTVYAVSDYEDDEKLAISKGNLRDVKYQSFGIYLKKPFLTLDNVASRVAKGDELKVTGVAEGSPDDVNVWIFGKNMRTLGEPESVEDDGTFEYTMERAATERLTSGQYFLIIQHPMTDGVMNVHKATQKEFDDAVAAGKLAANANINDVMVDATGNVVDLGRLPASEAATALIDALNSQNCDDTYAKVSFQVEEARIDINAIGDQQIGTKFTISGTTNLAVGDELNVDLTGASFGPSEKTQASGFSGASGQAIVEAGDDLNTWSFEVDATDFKPDQYTVTVESVDAGISTSQTFNVLETVPTTETEPTPSVTTETPEEPTTTVPETTAPPTPGFGALVALVGLGAVAFLVMRRN